MSSTWPRLAGAPISWGVSEVPAWGHRMAARRVLAEMREAGLQATELGPPGFLPVRRQCRRGPRSRSTSSSR